MRSGWPALVLLAPLVTACRGPTQITFDVTTDVACSEIGDTAFTSGPLSAFTDDRGPTSVAHGCSSTQNIGSVVVIPSGGNDDLVAVEVVVGIGVEPSACGPTTKCIVAKRALRFIPRTPLLVHIDMSSACEGVVCDGDQTCVDRLCVSALIPSSSECEGSGCTSSVLTLPDGGTPDYDAATDATIASDAAADAAPDATMDAELDAAMPVDASDASPSCITCAVGATQCASATSVQTCDQVAACTAWNAATTCDPSTGTTPYVCERSVDASCVDPNWAEWPMPNAPGSSAPNLESYTDNGDGTVTDGVTQLMWQQSQAPGVGGDAGYTQTNAVSYCAGLTLGNHRDWRLPSEIELLSLLDLSRAGPAINPLFPDTLLGYFCSSTPIANAAPGTWAVDFDVGYVGGGAGESDFVRCVR